MPGWSLRATKCFPGPLPVTAAYDWCGPGRAAGWSHGVFPRCALSPRSLALKLLLVQTRAELRNGLLRYHLLERSFLRIPCLVLFELRDDLRGYLELASLPLSCVVNCEAIWRMLLLFIKLPQGKIFAISLMPSLNIPNGGVQLTSVIISLFGRENSITGRKVLHHSICSTRTV